MNEMHKNKPVAVITGAASGLGLAISKECLKQNMRVVMTDIDGECLTREITALKEDGSHEILSVVCDVSSFLQLKNLAAQVMEHFGRVDLLINNAGIMGSLAPIWEQTDEQIQQVLAVNLHGVIHGVRAFLPVLIDQKNRSHVVNMASFYGLCSGSNLSAYAMSKNAIVALSESLHFDLKRLKKPVDVSVVCPSFVNTQLLTNSSPEKSDNLHHMMEQLIQRARPSKDVAYQIMDEIKKKKFYILPDKEVKNDIQQRVDAIINQAMPHEHNLERIMSALSKRCLKIK